MATVQRFEDIEAWQKAKLLCTNIHKLIITPLFSKDYKLRDQINGASGLVMDNIAEGFGRGSRLEFVNFLSMAEAQLPKFSHNFTERLIGNILTRSYSTLTMRRQTRFAK